jgi:hypothetical protein
VARVKSLLLILFTGVLFVTGVVLEALQVLFGKYINEIIHGSGIFFNGVLSFLISIFITTVWFTMLFHYIPDGKSKWKVSMSGALLDEPVVCAWQIRFKTAAGRQQYRPGIRQVRGFCTGIALCILFRYDHVLRRGFHKDLERLR